MIALGKLLGRCKIFGISLGVTWILFVGIIFSYFGFNLDPSLLHFIKELGYEPQVSLAEGVKRTVAWWKQENHHES